MKKGKPDLLLGRRDLLKLLPQSAAYWALAPSLPSFARSPDETLPAGSSEIPHLRVAWAAEWIWEPMKAALHNSPARILINASTPLKNLFTYFRETIDLSHEPQRASVRISADSRYQLYVNGRYVGRGPARCTPVWQFYDKYEIAPLLQKGKNAIAVLLHFYGESTGWYILGRPGLLLECAIRLANGKTVLLKTDKSWKFLRASAYAQDTPRKNDSPGFVEVYDARQAAKGWALPSYDDSNGQKSSIIPRASTSPYLPPVLPPFPWENLLTRDIPMLIEKEILPTKVLMVGEVQNLSPAHPVTPALQMSEETPVPLEICTIQNAGSLTSARGGKTIVRTTSLKATGEKSHSAVLILDFGREITGYPRIELDGAAGGIADLGVSESLANGRVTPMRNGLHCNRYIMKNGQQTWEAFEWDGFRYLQLTPRNCVQPVTLNKVAVNFTSHPVGNAGTRFSYV